MAGLMREGREPPNPSHVGDLWLNTNNKMVYCKLDDKTWICTDIDGDVVDRISETENKSEAESDWDRAMGIL